MRPEAIIFDLDDTLVVEEASAEAAFIETSALAEEKYGVDPAALHATVRQVCRGHWHDRSPARAFCMRIGISSWEGMWARFAGDSPDLKRLREWSPWYRRQSWIDALAVHGIEDPELADRLAETFPAKRRKLHVVYPDVAPVLVRLRQVYPLGLLTNGAPGLQREKIAGAGVGGYFEAIGISGDIGVSKPDRRPFAFMLEALGAPPERTLMVGNSLESDVQGAKNAGITAVWLNRTGEPRDDEITPDREIHGLDELTEWLLD